jgi:very-short-patch-repair endonuclease
MSRTSHLAAHRSPNGVDRAKALRRSMTDAERRLWYYLRARRFENWKFRRQVPLGPFVVDFLCEEARVIVEVDGGQPALQSGHDAERTRWLGDRGYTVLRYWNNEVLGNIEGVLATLTPALSQGRGGKATLTPAFSPGRGSKA